MARRSKQNLNHYRIMSGRMGELLPVSCMEVLPGDSFRHMSTALLRLSPMVTPVMHPIHIRMHSFFVPNRLAWTLWEDFIVDMETDLTVPGFVGTNIEGSVMDYLGVPPGDYSQNPVNNLPLRAYNLIWNEFFRDQDLDEERVETDNVLAKIRWEKDYFTTARLEAQNGASEVVDIEFDQDIPIAGIGNRTDIPASTPNVPSRESDGSDATYAQGWVNNTFETEENPDFPGYPHVRIPAGAAGGTMDINAWRQAMAFQRLSEARNKYGSRYTDYLNYLGVRSSDARLQRPEYLGGGSATVSISEVLSTSDTKTDVQTGQELGTLAGHGIAGHRTRPYRYFAEEHGHIITLASVRPKSIYSNAMHRNWLRQKPADYWQKEMEMMGDQPVQVREIKSDAADPTAIFGYVDRHKDYRQMFSGTAGEMRSVLDTWHLAREFTADPQLNSTFVECTPTERIFAENITDTFQLQVKHKVSARRLVSKNSRV